MRRNLTALWISLEYTLSCSARFFNFVMNRKFRWLYELESTLQSCSSQDICLVEQEQATEQPKFESTTHIFITSAVFLGIGH